MVLVLVSYIAPLVLVDSVQKQDQPQPHRPQMRNSKKKSDQVKQKSKSMQTRQEQASRHNS